MEFLLNGAGVGEEADEGDNSEIDYGDKEESIVDEPQSEVEKLCSQANAIMKRCEDRTRDTNNVSSIPALWQMVSSAQKELNQIDREITTKAPPAFKPSQVFDSQGTSIEFYFN